MKNNRLSKIYQLFCSIQWIIILLILLFFPACSHGDISHKDLNHLFIFLLVLFIACIFILLIQGNKRLQQMSSIEQELDSKSKELIQARAELLEKENVRIINLSNEDDLRKRNFFQTEIYLKIKDISNDEEGKKMTREDWIALEKELNNIYDNFAVRLKSCCEQISETELHVCYLLKAGFSVTSISKIIGRTKSAVSMCRRRLLEKINGCDCPAADLDDFISTI